MEVADRCLEAPIASIVIPAHDENRVIGRLLASLERQTVRDNLEIIVVANGCSDDTVGIAWMFGDRLPGLVVVELADADKRSALEAGDRRATAFPRVFADADIEFDAGSVDSLIDSLPPGRPMIGAPRIVFDDSSASHVVRAFYRVFRRLPYVTSNLVGLGVYGMTEEGRRRFGRFPDVTADDLFVQRLFSPGERVQSRGVFTVRTPLRLGPLISVRTRVAAGNRQLTSYASTAHEPVDGGSSTRSTTRALVELARGEPRRLPDVLIYVGITLIARIRSRRFDAAVWHRDESSRA